jgi:predicted transcriptional regulator
MITVSELAKDLQVSTSTVYRMLRSVEQSNAEILTEKHKGTTYFTQKGEELIRERLAPIERLDNHCLSMTDNDEQGENAEMLVLRQQNEMLMKELEREREQVDELKSELKIERDFNRNIANTLAELTSNSQDLTRNSQQLFALQSKNPLLLSDERAEVISEENEREATKQGIFSKIFKKGKKKDSQ